MLAAHVAGLAPQSLDLGSQLPIRFDGGALAGIGGVRDLLIGIHGICGSCVQSTLSAPREWLC